MPMVYSLTGSTPIPSATEDAEVEEFFLPAGGPWVPFGTIAKETTIVGIALKVDPAAVAAIAADIERDRDR